MNEQDAKELNLVPPKEKNKPKRSHSIGRDCKEIKKNKAIYKAILDTLLLKQIITRNQTKDLRVRLKFGLIPITLPFEWTTRHAVKNPEHNEIRQYLGERMMRFIGCENLQKLPQEVTCKYCSSTRDCRISRDGKRKNKANKLNCAHLVLNEGLGLYMFTFTCSSENGTNHKEEGHEVTLKEGSFVWIMQH
jgi:hypothetical protein